MSMTPIIRTLADGAGGIESAIVTTLTPDLENTRDLLYVESAKPMAIEEFDRAVYVRGLRAFYQDWERAGEGFRVTPERGEQ